MKKLPEVSTNFNALFNSIFEILPAKLMLAGIELKIFTELSEPRTAEAVAKTMGFHSKNTKIFLDALVACHLLLMDDNLYFNTPETQEFLVERKPTYIGGFLKDVVYQRLEPSINNLTELVSQGSLSIHGDNKKKYDFWEEPESRLMFNYQRAGYAQKIADFISNLPEFSSFKRMLDLGAGAGFISVAVVQKHSLIQSVIFEQSSVAKIAQKVIQEYEMDDRIQVIEGNFFHDDIGENYDLIWASSTLSSSKAQLELILKKIYDALNPEGMFISLHPGLSHSKATPQTMNMARLLMSLTGFENVWFEKGILADFMRSVGFQSMRSCSLDLPVGTMDIDIGRKL